MMNDGKILLCNLFYYAPCEHYTDSMFEEMWNYDWEEFIYIIFYLRKHRRTPKTQVVGRGERKIFHQVIIWMSSCQDKLSILLGLLPHIPNYGYWKDLLVLMGTPAETAVIKLFGDQLIRDYISYHSHVPGLISMAAKWTPNEHSSSDIRHNTYGKITRYMGVSRKILRKEYLVPLRQYLPVTEQLISNKQWSSINYNMVPQLALKLHSNSFLRNDRTRFVNHINTSYIDHVKKLILPPPAKAFLTPYNPIQPNFKLIGSTNTIKAIDVSGSMSGFPITLAACMCFENNDSRWIPFRFDGDADGRFFDISEDNYFDSIVSTSEKDVPGCDLLTCIELAQSQSVSHLIIITNIPIDESEFPIYDVDNIPIHVTYWVISINPVNVIDRDSMTVIEGYDINVYNALVSGYILNRNSYKNIIMTEIRADNILLQL